MNGPVNWILLRTSADAPFLHNVGGYTVLHDAVIAARHYLNTVDTRPHERLHIVNALTGSVERSIEVQKTVKIVEIDR